VRPQHPLVTSTVRWLMAARTDGAWETTHDTSMSLLTLTDYLAASGDTDGAFSWQVAVNGQSQGGGTVGDAASKVASTRVSVPVVDLLGSGNRVDLSRGAGPGRLYYTVQLKSYTPAEDAAADSHGLSIGREYFMADGRPLGDVHVGDLVLVKLSLVAPDWKTHLLVEDPLPAGLEAVDLSLNTTSQAARRLLSEASKSRDSFWVRQDIHDDRVALFSSWLPRGAREYVYLARATTPGQFRVPPARALQQYFPSVQAQTDGQRFTILP
jgi:hypothetical protein